MKKNYKSTWRIWILLLFSHSAFSQISFIDPTFGNNGKVIHNFYNQNRCMFGIVQPDGKLVLIGYADASSAASENFAISRYTVDGIIDSTFSGDGIDTVDLNGFLDEALHLTIDSLDRILVTGKSYGPIGNFGIIRYNSDGTHDSTFSGDGKVTQMLPGTVESYAIKTRNNGKILVAGSHHPGDDDVFLMQFNDDGTPDSLFGTNGFLTFTLPNNDRCNNIVEQPDGKLITSGYKHISQNFYGLLMMRINVDGSLDSTFNGNGIMIDSVDFGQAQGMVLQPDGKIVVAGVCNHLPNYHTIIARYHSNGSPDSTFGSTGRIETIIGNANSLFYDIWLQGDGKILAIGNASGNLIQLLRFNTDGSIDQTFGVNGYIANSISTSTNIATAVVVQPSGKIVLIGRSAIINGPTTYAVFSMIRYGLNVNTGVANEVIDNYEISIYPNPVSHSTTIYLNSSNGSGKNLKLYDVTGRLHENQHFSDRSLTLDLSRYSTGIYFFSVTDVESGKVYTGKIIKD